MRLSARRKELILGVYIEESILQTTGQTRHDRRIYSLDSSIIQPHSRRAGSINFN